MEDEKEDIWKASKILEEDESGELRLLPDNLDKLQRYLNLNECDVADLNIISVIGAQANENAFLTNLLPVFLKKNGKDSWSHLLSKEGLGGFAFGTIVENKENDIISSENTNEENLLRRADSDNHQHSSNEENTRHVDQENKEKELEDVCESVSGINLENDQPANLNPEDEKDHTQEPIALENSNAGFSGMNLQQRKEIYKIATKFILHAGILPQTCGDDLVNATGALFSAAQMFEGVPMNFEDDMQSGDSAEDFVMVETFSQKFEDFVTCSNEFMKYFQKIPVESFTIRTEANEPMDDNNGLMKGTTDQMNKNIEQVGRNNGSCPGESDNLLEKCDGHDESNNSPEKSNDTQDESNKLPENDNRQMESDNLPANGNNGPVEVTSEREEHVHSSAECSIGYNEVNNGPEDIKDQVESHKDQKDIITRQVVTNEQPEGKGILETCLDKDDSDNGKQQAIISPYLFQPDENRNAIYAYPEIISTKNDDGKEMKWCILHLHKKSNGLAEDNQNFEKFLLDVCTRVVRISEKETTSVSAQCNVANVEGHLLNPHQHKRVFNIVIENERESNFRFTANPKSIQVTKDTFSIDHDGSGILNLVPKHLRTLSFLLKNITKFQIDSTEEAGDESSHLKYTNFPQYIIHKLSEFILTPESGERMESSGDLKSTQMSSSSMAKEQGNISTPLSLANKKVQDDKNMDTSLAEKMEALKVTKISEPPEDKIIEASIRKQWKELDRKLAEWIEKELDLGNVRKMLSLYETWLTDITKNISETREIEKSKMKRIKESMKQRANEKCKPIIDEVIEGVDHFCAYFREHFGKKLCFQNNVMEIALEERKKKTLILSDKKEAIKLMNLGYDKLARILRNYNQKWIDAGKRISLEAQHKIRNIYATKMEHILSSKIPMDPETLGQFHDALTSDMLVAYKKCLDNNIAISKDMEHLHHNLLADFQVVFEKNMLLLELSQKKVKGFIGKSKSGYEEIMDNLLKKNRSGIDPEDFEKTHLDEYCKAENRLRRSILTDEELKEPIDNHLVTLKKHIEKSYKTFKEDNEDFLEKSVKSEKGIKADSSNKESENPHRKSSRKLDVDSEKPAIDFQCPRKRIKRDLQPMLYQIAINKIGIATLAGNSWDSDSGSLDIQSHSGEVGILMDGKWVCGDDVKEFNQRGNVQKAWSFKSLFNTYDFDDNVVINKDTIYVTLPFLLGIFFGIMKQRSEDKHNGKISTAMISVPFWFSSKKRRQVVEAGMIAGFDNVHLINENTASAYFAYANASCSPIQKMVVITENSTRVDVSIYSYDQQSKVISMIGQSGDYETIELSKQEGFIKKFLNGIGVLEYFSNHQQENGVREKALESLDKVWNLAKSRVDNHWNPNYRTVLISSESDQWREFLWKFAEKITSPENIAVRNDSPLFGLASIFHTSVARPARSVEHLFKDAIPFNLILSQGNKTLDVIKKNHTFSSSETHFCFKLPKSAGYFHFSEEDSVPHILEKLHLKSKPPHSFKIKATLERTKNGTLIPSSVNYTESGSHDWGPWKLLPDHYFEWLPCKTNDETLVATYRSLVDQITLQTKTSREIENVLKPTEEKAEKIKEAIQACTDRFKSSLGKNMAIRQIDDIIEALKQPGIQAKQLKKHATYLDSIVQKYDLQI